MNEPQNDHPFQYDDETWQLVEMMPFNLGMAVWLISNANIPSELISEVICLQQAEASVRRELGRVSHPQAHPEKYRDVLEKLVGGMTNERRAQIITHICYESPVHLKRAIRLLTAEVAAARRTEG